jgi:hypothetical protein
VTEESDGSPSRVITPYRRGSWDLFFFGALGGVVLLVAFRLLFGPEQPTFDDVEFLRIFVIVCTGILAARAVNYLSENANWRRKTAARQELYHKDFPAMIARDPYRAYDRIKEYLGLVTGPHSASEFVRHNFALLAVETEQLQALLAEAEKAIRADRIAELQAKVETDEMILAALKAGVRNPDVGITMHPDPTRWEREIAAFKVDLAKAKTGPINWDRGSHWRNRAEAAAAHKERVRSWAAP